MKKVEYIIRFGLFAVLLSLSFVAGLAFAAGNETGSAFAPAPSPEKELISAMDGYEVRFTDNRDLTALFELIVRGNAKNEMAWFRVGEALEKAGREKEYEFCYARVIDGDFDWPKPLFIKAKNMHEKFREKKWSPFCDAAKPALGKAFKYLLPYLRDRRREMRRRNMIAKETVKTEYVKDFEKAKAGTVVYETLELDTAANVLVRTVCDADQKMVSAEKFTYDGFGLPLTAEYSNATGSAPLRLKHEYKLDRFGMLSIEVCLNADTGAPVRKTDYAYKFHTNMPEMFETVFDAAGQRIGKFEISWDFLGNPVYVALYDRDGVGSWSFDKKYHWIDHIVYYENDGIMIRHGHFHERDDYGNIVKTFVRVPEIKVGAPFKHEKVDTIGTYSYKYDAYGNPVEEIYRDKDASVVYKREFSCEYHPR